MGIGRKLELIRMARRLHLPEGSDVAGDRGEQDVLRALGRVFRERPVIHRCYPAIRIPRPGGERGKFEIDLLVVTPHALVGIEVKNWGGHVEAGGDGVWRQDKGRGDVREHQDPISLVAMKMAALGEWLRAKGRIEVDPSAMHSFVVSTNPSMTLGPPAFRDNRLIRLDDFEPVFASLVSPNRPGLWPRLRRLIGLDPTIPPAIGSLPGVLEALDRLPTWDLVQLHGGKVLKGDLLNPEIALTSGKSLRRDARRIALRIPRHYFPGLFQSPSASWSDWDGLKGDAKLVPGQVLTIRLAGRGEEISVPLETVERIDFGRRDDSAYESAIRAGDTFEGTVRGIKDFGVFVGIDRHRDGLIHISRLRRHNLSPENFRPGAAVRVRVVSVTADNGKERVDLDLQ